MPILRVEKLFIYPVKSCSGIKVKDWPVGPRGFKFDREWMLVDDDGKFISQRTVPRMCLLRADIHSWLTLSAVGMKDVNVPLDVPADLPRITVTVWKSSCLATVERQSVNRSLSEFLGVSCRLVRIAPEDERTATQGSARLAFADGYPFLGLSRTSVTDLNRRITDRTGMVARLRPDRFRPNLFFSGCDAYAEDAWQRITIGSEVTLEGQTRCVRCVITCTNQKTAEVLREPLATLAAYRKTPDGVVFGRNFNHITQGHICADDRVIVQA